MGQASPLTPGQRGQDTREHDLEHLRGLAHDIGGTPRIARYGAGIPGIETGGELTPCSTSAFASVEIRPDASLSSPAGVP